MNICKQIIISSSLLFLLFFGIASAQAAEGGATNTGCCYWVITDSGVSKQDGVDMERTECYQIKVPAIKAATAKSCPTCTVVGSWSPYPCSDFLEPKDATGGSTGTSTSGTGSTSTDPADASSTGASAPGTSVSGSPTNTTAKKLGGLASTASRAGYGERTLTGIAGDALRVILSLVGVLFLLLMIYGGYVWMTAGGNEKTAGKGKTIIAGAVLGLLVVVGAYVFTSFIGESIIP